MNRTSLRRALVFGAVLAVRPAVTGADEKPAAESRAGNASAPTVEVLAAAERDFAFDLHRQVVAGGGNVFSSPYSVSTALAMTAIGAKGVTAAELRKALHLPEGYGPGYRALASSVTTIPMVGEYDDEMKRTQQKPAYSMSIANSIFSQAGWTFASEFRRSVAEDFRSEFTELDFGNPDSARAVVNDWVAKKTHDRIKDILGKGSPTPDTRMMLANAIHFKGAWAAAFREGGTEDGPFVTGDDKSVTAKQMRLVKKLPYAETADAQVLELAYRGDEMSMVVVLPKAKQGLAAIEKSIDGASFVKWVGALERKRVDVTLPKFTVTSSFDLVGALGALGVKAAFVPDAADFTGIAEKPPLYIGAIAHKAFVAVDELGTEAAAATVVEMKTLSAPALESPPIPFTVDHPFLFAIRHVPTGAILFLGRITDPTR